MSACDCQTNQTTSKTFEILRAKGDHLGTGLFMIPDPTKGILENQVVVVKNLDYRETVKRGENCIAFKWIAPDEATYDAILETRQSGRCSGYCGPNRDWCLIGCMCGSGNYCE